MSKGYWLTPEEMIKRKKLKKNLTYSFIALGTILLSAVFTFVANNI